MNAKEQAEYLFMLFRAEFKGNWSDGIDTRISKSSAKICVEQMLLMDTTGMILPIDYWNDVLKEIELI